MPGGRRGVGVITVDTHESWDGDVADRVLALASAASLFVPSQEELAGLVAADGRADGLRALAAAGLTRAVVKAAEAGAYVLDDGRIIHVPAAETTAADSTGAGDTFCGGLAAGLARGLSVVESAALGAAVAAVAITGSGSLRLLRPGTDRAGNADDGTAAGRGGDRKEPRPGGLPAGGMRTAGLVKEAGGNCGPGASSVPGLDAAI